MTNKQTNKQTNPSATPQDKRSSRLNKLLKAFLIFLLIGSGSALGGFLYHFFSTPKDAQAACAALPAPGLTYVGSCSAVSRSCKCNAGETIMLPQDFNFQSQCTVFNQGNNSVIGTANWDGCTYSCFR